MTDDQIDAHLLGVLNSYTRDKDGFFRYASTLRVMRDLSVVPKAVCETVDEQKGSPFLVTLAALERLRDKGIVQCRELDDETAQWRAVGLLDALAQAANEDDDE